MTELIIDEELKNLIPPLGNEEFNQLRENILRDGIQDPLKVWNGTLIDGHNRYTIAQKHNLAFSTVEMQFESRDDAVIWIIKNQFGRRNLTAYDRSLLALKLKPLIAAKAKEKQGERTDLKTKEYPVVTTKTRDVAEPELSPNIWGKLDISDNKQSRTTHESETNSQVAKLANVSTETIRKVEVIEKKIDEEIKAALKSGDISINQAYKKIKEKERKENIQKQVEVIEQKAIEKPDGLFEIIAIDPPWGYGTQYSASGRRVANPYPEMTQEKLKAIELPAAENCVLFLWTTHQFIWDAKELLDTWGFKYRCMLVWDKKQIGMGNLIRMQCEFCLVAIKGNPVFKDVHDIRDLIEEPRREHSRKPDEFYSLVNRLCTGRKLDYFSRESREGWETYGNDTKKFDV